MYNFNTFWEYTNTYIRTTEAAHDNILDDLKVLDLNGDKPVQQSYDELLTDCPLPRTPLIRPIDRKLPPPISPAKYRLSKSNLRKFFQNAANRIPKASRRLKYPIKHTSKERYQKGTSLNHLYLADIEKETQNKHKHKHKHRHSPQKTLSDENLIIHNKITLTNEINENINGIDGNNEHVHYVIDRCRIGNDNNDDDNGSDGEMDINDVNGKNSGESFDDGEYSLHSQTSDFSNYSKMSDFNLDHSEIYQTKKDIKRVKNEQKILAKQLYLHPHLPPIPGSNELAPQITPTGIQDAVTNASFSQNNTNYNNHNNIITVKTSHAPVAQYDTQKPTEIREKQNIQHATQTATIEQTQMTDATLLHPKTGHDEIDERSKLLQEHSNKIDSSFGFSSVSEQSQVVKTSTSQISSGPIDITGTGGTIRKDYGAVGEVIPLSKSSISIKTKTQSRSGSYNYGYGLYQASVDGLDFIRRNREFLLAKQRKKQEILAKKKMKICINSLMQIRFLTQLAYGGLLTSITLFMRVKLHDTTAQAGAKISTWTGVCYITPLFGAYLADAKFGRAKTLLIFIFIFLIGMIGITASTFMIQFDNTNYNTDVTSSNEPNDPLLGVVQTLFWISMYIIALGIGGTKPTLSPLGADQFRNVKIPDIQKQRSAYFSWLYFSANAGAILSSTLIAWLCQDVQFSIGYSVTCVAVILSIASYYTASKYYVQIPPTGSVFSRFIGASFVGLKHYIFNSHNGKKTNKQITNDRKYSISEENTNFIMVSDPDNSPDSENKSHENQNNNSDDNNENDANDEKHNAHIDVTQKKQQQSTIAPRTTMTSETPMNMNIIGISPIKPHETNSITISQDFTQNTYVKSDVTDDNRKHSRGSHSNSNSNSNSVSESQSQSQSTTPTVSLLSINMKQRTETSSKTGETMDFHPNVHPPIASTSENINCRESTIPSNLPQVSHQLQTSNISNISQSQTNDSVTTVKLSSASPNKRNTHNNKQHTHSKPLHKRMMNTYGTHNIDQQRRRQSDSDTSNGDSMHWLDVAKKSHGGDYTDKFIDDIKCVYRVLPSLLPFPVAYIIYTNQLTLVYSQGCQMNITIGNNWNFPIGSLSLVSTIVILLFVPITEHFIYPFFENTIHIQITTLKKIGLSFILCIMAMIIAAITEYIRRLQPLIPNYYSTCDATLPVNNMSIFWQIPQFVLLGASRVLINTGAQDFLYTEAPKSMKATLSSINYAIDGLGAFLGSLSIEIVNIYKNNEWIPNDLNQGRLDYYFLMMGFIMFVLTMFFVNFAKHYHYSVELDTTLKKTVSMNFKEFGMTNENFNANNLKEVNGTK